MTVYTYIKVYNVVQVMNRFFINYDAVDHLMTKYSYWTVNSTSSNKGYEIVKLFCVSSQQYAMTSVEMHCSSDFISANWDIRECIFKNIYRETGGMCKLG